MYIFYKKKAEKLINSDTYFWSNYLADLKIIPIHLNEGKNFQEEMTCFHPGVSHTRAECSFGEERFFSVYRSQSRSEGSQGKNSSRNLEAGLPAIHTALPLTQKLTSETEACDGSGVAQRFTMTLGKF